MQKVERKTHRDGKHRRLIWLAAAFVLLAGSVTAAVLLSRKPEETLIEPEDHSGLLVDRQVSELVSVTVERRDDPAWTLVQAEDGTLQPKGGAEWTPNEQQATMLAEAMTQLRYEEVLTEDPEVYRGDPAAFGLENPAVNVTAEYSDGSSITVHIGNDTGLEEGWYYMTAEGDDRLFAASRGLVEDLDIEYALLRPVPRPEIYGSLLDRITITGRDGEKIAEWTLKGNISDRDAGSNWVVSSPFVTPADEESIQNLKKSAENLRLGVYTAPATKKELEQYGLTTPEMTLTFHMAAGSTGTVSENGVYDVTVHDESTVILYIGSAHDELADYVRFEDEIFTVSHFTLSAFTEPDPMGSAARYPVLTPLASLESLTTEENGVVHEYIIIEGEQASDEEEPSARRCTLDGEEISYDTFEAAYDRLLTVTYSGTLPKDAEWKEPYKKYTFHTLSGGTHTIELCDWDGVHDAVTVDGTTIFYLIKGGMTSLPGEDQ